MSSIKVAVRARPLGYNELRDGCQSCVGFPGGDDIIIGGSKQFTFDYVFSDQSTQQDIYDIAVKDIKDNLFIGYNVTVLAYGQTGSGKTYTMGTNCRELYITADTGIIPRTIYDIYQNFEAMKDKVQVSVKVSFIEVYNEEIFDLLSPTKEMRTLREENQDVKIPGLIEQCANNIDDIFRCLVKGSENRAVGSTAMNETSSRSHAIFTLYISIVSLNSGLNNVESVTSKLHLVDLAGSERASKTGATGDRFKEGVNINRGLLALGNVISSLVERDRLKDRNKHIPYRESKLTRLLQDSLGGNTKTLMLACISPADFNFEETASSLNYAARARMIQNKPVINKVNSTQSEIFQLRAQVTALMAQLKGTLTDSSLNLSNPTSSMLQTNQYYESSAKLVAMQRERNQLLEYYDEEVSKKDELLKKLWEQMSNDDKQKDDLFEELDRYVQEVISKDEQEDTEMEFEEKTSENPEDNEVTMKRNNFLRDLREELETKEKKLVHTEEDLKVLQHYEDKNRELELRIKELEGERNRKSHHSRQEEVEGQLKEARRQLIELQNFKREKDRKTEEVNQLKLKIQELKTSIVKATKDMSKEKATLKKMAADKEKEYKILVHKDQQLQSRMERQNMQHAKETAVLKRKLESGAANEKRLKELLENRKNFSMNRIARDNKNIDNQVKLWIQQCLDHAADNKETRQRVDKLFEKRRKLTDQLDILDVNNEHESRTQIEQEIRGINECVSLQQANLSDSSHDVQMASNWNQLRNINECRVAIKFMFKQLVEERVTNIMNAAEMLDLRAQIASLDELNATLNTEIVFSRTQFKSHAQKKLRKRRTTMATDDKVLDNSEEPVNKKKKCHESACSDVESVASSIFSDSSNRSRRSSRVTESCRCKNGCKLSRCGCLKSDTPCSKKCQCKGDCGRNSTGLVVIAESCLDTTFVNDASDKENAYSDTSVCNEQDVTICNQTFINLDDINPVRGDRKVAVASSPLSPI